MVQIAVNLRDFFSFTFNRDTMDLIIDKFACKGHRLRVVYNRSQIRLYLDEVPVDVGAAINIAHGSKIVPDFFDNQYRYCLSAYDKIADIYMVFFFNDRNRLKECSEYSNAKQTALFSYFRSLDDQNREKIFREFESKVKQHSRKIGNELNACSDLYRKLMSNEPLSIEYVQTLDFLEPDLKDDVYNISQTGCSALFADEVKELCEAKKQLLQSEKKLYASLIKNKEEIFSSLLFKSYSSLSEAIEEGYLFDLAKVKSSAIFQVHDKYILVVKCTESSYYRGEWLFTLVDKVFLSYLKEYGKEILNDAIKVIRQYNL